MDKNYDSWYYNLKKSSLTPPNYVFPIVWSILYIMIFYSFYLYLIGENTTTGIILFIIQLVLNLSWSPVFFNQKDPKTALNIVVIMWLFILATIISFNNTNKLASYLLIPYFIWTTLATYLNYYIVSNN